MMPGLGFFENQDYGLDSRPFFAAIIVTCLPGIHRFAVMAAAISTEREKRVKKLNACTDNFKYYIINSRIAN